MEDSRREAQEKPDLDQLLSKGQKDWMAEASTRGYVNYDGTYINFHTIDRQAILLANRAFENRSDLGLVYPLPFCNIHIPMAYGILYWLYDLKDHESPVLLLTERTELRTIYLSLRVSSLSMNRVFPIARVGGDYRLKNIGKKDPYGKKPRLVITSNPYFVDVAPETEYAAAIVDHGTDQFRRHVPAIHNWGKNAGVRSLIHVFNNPFDPTLSIVRELNVPIFGWPRSLIQSELKEKILARRQRRRESEEGNPFTACLAHLAHLASGLERSFVECSSPEYEQSTQEVAELLGELAKEPPAGISDFRRAVAEAYSATHMMDKMVVPVKMFEDFADASGSVLSIEDRLRDLKLFGETANLPDETATRWQSLLGGLKHMKESLEVQNPKAEALLGMCSKKQPLVVACPNHVIVNSLESLLEEQMDLDFSREDCPIRLVHYRMLTEESCEVNELVFPGRVIKRYRHLHGVCCAPTTVFVTYPHERQAIEEDIDTWAHHIERTLGGSVIGRSLERILGRTVSYSLPESEATPLPKRVKEEESTRPGRRTGKISVSVSFDDIEEETEEQEAHGGSEIFYSGPTDTEDESVTAEETVEALRIEFEDGRYVYARPLHEIPVFLPKRSDVTRRKAGNLRQSDLVIFVDGEQKRGLNEVVISRIERHPKMEESVRLTKEWVKVLQKGYVAANDDPWSLLEKLEEKGTDITSPQTVENWLRGDVIGPRNKENLRFIGEIYGNQRLTKNYVEFYKAIRRVRSVRIGLLGQMSRISLEAGVKGLSGDDGVVSEELNLYLDDFKDIVTMHRVRSISEGHTVQYHQTLRLLD